MARRLRPRTVAGFHNVAEVVGWLSPAFDPVTADALIQGNARRLLARVLGVADRLPGA